MDTKLTGGKIAAALFALLGGIMLSNGALLGLLLFGLAFLSVALTAPGHEETPPPGGGSGGGDETGGEARR